MHTVCMTQPAHSTPKGKEVSPMSVFLLCLSAYFSRFQYLQAFSTILKRANSGNSSNTTADDVRAVLALGYLSFSPDFPALNQAFHAALSGNWSDLSYSSFGPVYTASFAPALPLVCLDGRESSQLPLSSSLNFSLLYRISNCQ